MSQPKRRTNGLPNPPSTSTTIPKHSNTTISKSPTSRSRLLLLAVYPSILILGSLFSVLEPHARAAPYSVLTQSHPPELAPSYFARKSNVLNQYFVKILWLWITGAFALFLALHPLTSSTNASNNTNTRTRADDLEPWRRKAQALLRYSLVTLLWVFTTQWFFGPALIDRGFRYSGGKCELVEAGVLSDEPAKEFVTAAACKIAGGRWAGGHDVSGHVFILILGSAFLLFEAGPVIERWINRREARVGEEIEKIVDSGIDGAEGQWGLSMGVVSGVAGTSLWMLLMTATYFHTWFEKLTGLLVAFIGIGVVYVLPHYILALRSIIGRPGI